MGGGSLAFKNVHPQLTQIADRASRALGPIRCPRRHSENPDSNRFFFFSERRSMALDWATDRATWPIGSRSSRAGKSNDRGRFRCDSRTRAHTMSTMSSAPSRGRRHLSTRGSTLATAATSRCCTSSTPGAPARSVTARLVHGQTGRLVRDIASPEVSPVREVNPAAGARPRRMGGFAP